MPHTRNAARDACVTVRIADRPQPTEPRARPRVPRHCRAGHRVTVIGLVPRAGSVWRFRVVRENACFRKRSNKVASGEGQRSAFMRSVTLPAARAPASLARGRPVRVAPVAPRRTKLRAEHRTAPPRPRPAAPNDAHGTRGTHRRPQTRRATGPSPNPHGQHARRLVTRRRTDTYSVFKEVYTRVSNPCRYGTLRVYGTRYE